MQVSIIIPVYNAAPFVSHAVESALAQPETYEVILVEDGSPDDSLTICRQLASMHDAVHLFQHPNGENRGAGASRNLAIEQSTSEFIAFLDADDYFLPNRFRAGRDIFENDPTVDGVYGAIEMDVMDRAGASRWERSGRILHNRLHTMSRHVAPEELFEALVSSQYGSFSIDGLVVKRTLFERTGLFDTDLRLHQDTVMFLKMAAKGRLVAGSLEEPVARWRVHENNRVSAPRPLAAVYADKMDYWYTVYQWSRQHVSTERQQWVLYHMLTYAGSVRRWRWLPFGLLGFVSKRVQLLALAFSYPALLTQDMYWRFFLPRRYTASFREA